MTVDLSTIHPAGDPAGDAAGAGVWVAARAAWVAAGAACVAASEALAPTVAMLQESATALVIRMCEVDR